MRSRGGFRSGLLRRLWLRGRCRRWCQRCGGGDGRNGRRRGGGNGFRISRSSGFRFRRWLSDWLVNTVCLRFRLRLGGRGLLNWYWRGGLRDGSRFGLRLCRRRRGRGGGGRRSRFLNDGCFLSLRTLELASLVVLNSFFLQETEDIIENKVTVWLLSEEEGLHEFTPRLSVIRHFTDDLDDDTAIC